jgi:acylpyruvate hydrolase
LPEAPLLFAKWGNTLIGPGDPIAIPPIVTKCDYEAELGVVIGERVRGRLAANALEGRSPGTSASTTSRRRDLSSPDGQWTRGKSPTRSVPVGPALVPRDQIADRRRSRSGRS